jgi:hypothetical protein
VPREHVHEAAAALAAGGDPHYALLAARTSRDAEEACSAYGALRQVDLSCAAVLDESVATLAAVGSEAARADTFAGLLLAAATRGASGQGLVDIFDAGWLWVETGLSDTALVLLLGAFGGTLAADSRWAPRLVRCLADGRGGPLRGAILGWCGSFLEQGGRLIDHDTGRIAAALSQADQTQRIPRALFQHLWDWALQRQRPAVVGSLLALELPPEDRVFRQALLEGLMARLLRARPSRLEKVVEALDALEMLLRTARLDEDRLRALASRADRCPIHAAAYVAWLEECAARSEGPMAWRAALFRTYVRIGLVGKAAEVAKAFPDLKATLGVNPRRYLAAYPRPEVSWRRSAWEDALVSDFRRFLRDLKESGDDAPPTDWG